MNTPPSESEKKAMEIAVTFMEEHQTSSWAKMKEDLTQLLLEVFESGANSQRNNYTLKEGKSLIFHKCDFFMHGYGDTETLPKEEKKEYMDLYDRAIHNPDGESFIVGLTHADLLHLQIGGILEINPKTVGMNIDLPIVILYGGTHEHMSKALAKHHTVARTFVDSHKDKRN